MCNSAQQEHFGLNEEGEATAARLESMGFDLLSCVHAVNAAGGKYDLALKILTGSDYSSTPTSTASSASSSTNVQVSLHCAIQFSPEILV